ncbi:MAG: hypothetical protein FWC16_14885 [Defluviitaleaceae bacterium]|nr:hypothetical protein [Defluviitaleaceae bacterium]MCL2276201.1 hypothetical protein [Defluviitaleaceae bacterium]
MKLMWQDVNKFFAEKKIWVSGLEMYWYQYTWYLLEEANLTIYNSLSEKLAVYNRMYAIVKIYADFCEAAFDEYSDVDVYFEELADDRDEQNIYNDLIQDDDSMRTIFDILKTKLGQEGVFYSLWITNCSDDLNNPIDTYKDYITALNIKDYDDVLNNVSVDKLSSYEWLSDYM